MKGLFKRLSILTASLAMVFGVGLVNNEKKNANAATSSNDKITSISDLTTGNIVYVGTSATSLTYTVENNWMKMNSTESTWMEFEVTLSGSTFTLKSNKGYLYCSAAKKVELNASQGTNFEISTNGRFGNSTIGYFRLNSTGLRPYTSSTGSADGYLFKKQVEKTLKTLSLSGTLNKSTYTVGETFSSEGLTITANYSDGSTEDVTSKVTWPELTIGMTSITGTYEDKTILVTGITVKEKPTDLVLSEIKITEGENVKKTYYVGDSVDTTGLTVTAGYLSESDPSHESYVDVTDKVTWSLDTSAINAEAHLTATYIEGEITETTYIIVAVVAAPTYVVDKLAANNLTATDSTYTDFKDVTSTSGIKYAGNSASDGSNIQLRSKNSHSGIVSTTAKRILTKVEVEWGTGNTSSRTIDIYGYNTAFNDATELYNTKAVKLGSIGTSSTSFEVPAGTKYAYVGVRSNSGAIYLASISFTWDISSEANSFIDMWSQMRADGTNGICDYLNGSQDSSELDTLLEMYNDSSLIDAADKAIINDAADGENNTIGNSILYIAAYKAAHTSNNAGMNNAYHAVTNNISFILIISVIGLSSVLGYYFIQKRRLVK